MAGIAAYGATIRTPGTSTEIAATPLVQMGSAKEFMIADEALRARLPWDRNAPAIITVRDGSEDPDNPIGAYKVDYMLGIITFTKAPVGDNTRFNITVSYIPTLAIAGAMQYTVNLGSELLPSTSFKDEEGEAGNKTRAYGLLDVSISISRYDNLNKSFKQKMLDREPVLVEVFPAGRTEVIRGWFVVESANSQGGIGALETEDLVFQISTKASPAQLFSWGDNA